ncbi:MAG: hypothetical protein AAFQ81_15410, partial [Pseudomonadota bacterium]
GDGAWLEAYFTRTRAVRRSIIEAGQDTAAPNFGRGASSPSSSAETSGDEAPSPAPHAVGRG